MINLDIIRKLLEKFYYKTNEKRFTYYLRKKGVKLGNHCKFRGINSTDIDLTRPSLIEIGDYVDMNLNFTILTHDYATSVFLRKYNKFINSSGKVIIGSNIYFGKNCTVLKGVSIGDNCIIGAGSLIVKSIPANSVAVGVPARVICTIDEYYQRRKILCKEEAFEYAKSIKERYGRRPVEADFFEEFPLFVNGNEIEKYPTIPIRKQLENDVSEWEKVHNAPFSSFEEFLKAAGV